MIMSSPRNVLVLGSGAREDCLTWKLQQSPLVKSLRVSPGNASTVKQSLKESSKVVRVTTEDCGDVVNYCAQNDISMVVVGPEAHLARGIADDLKKKGISCFGPSQRASEIESSKKFAKDFMIKYGVPTARYEVFTSSVEACDFINNRAEYAALVVKANGLAAGKGVIVASNKQEACEAVTDLLQKYPDENGVVVEELLVGEEFSFLAFTDGHTVEMMPSAQDHKRLLDGDRGPNTGGMGAYCPCPQITASMMSYVKTNILQKTVDGMRNEGRKFVGVLYAGVIIDSASQVKVLEFNCRFGDPECEAILPLLKTDLFTIMESCVSGKLDTVNLEWNENHSCVTLILASNGYPGKYSKNIPIEGIEEVTRNRPNIEVFEAGTTFDSNTGSTLTSGGRVLAVSCVAPQLEEARHILMECVSVEKMVSFQSAVFRTDIAQKGINFVMRNKKLSYADSGVDIAEGNHLVSDIKSIVKKTKLSDGCVGDIGGFGCCFDLRAAGYDHPILVSGTDGVGTKLMIAHEMKSHETIGIDLVAMCVNDILTHNAQPLYFLDYYACSRLDRHVARDVIKGIATGCELAGCSLIGGETAEMPGMYPPNSYDLAGFAVGAYDRYKHRALPRVADVTPGDIIVGLSSSGLHSNGFSLVRKVMERCGVDCDYSLDGARLGDVMLTPTRTYVRPLISLLRHDNHGVGVRALAHITGGGLLENLPRVLPDPCGVQLDASLWPIPTIFAWLSAKGNIAEDEMLRTFNCGIGMCLIVDKNCADDVIAQLMTSQEDMWVGRIGVVTSRDVYGSGDVVKVKNFNKSLIKCYEKKLTNGSATTEPKEKKREEREEIKRKKIAVLISGSGTNLQSIMEYSRKTEEYDVTVVISNKETAFGLERAKRFGIETKVVNHKDFKNRQAFEEEVDKHLDDVDVVVLAGFMRILSDWFVKKWRGRIINIHPSLLPSFKGRNVHKQVLDAGAMITGCTVHFVIEGVDEGAIIAQQSVPVLPNDDVSKLEERVKTAEHDIFPRAIELVTSGKISLMTHHNKIEWN